MLVSPINYSGNKLKNLKNGMLEHFPKNINTFVDVFAGSCTVSLNTNANNYIINDLYKPTFDLYNLFINYDAEYILNNLKNIIDEYNLITDSNISFMKNHRDENLYEQHKNNYISLRTDYNKDKDVFKLYLLIIYSFCHSIRFNKKGDFNMPCGNDKFTNDHKNNIINFVNFFKNNNFEIYNKDFKTLDYSNLGQDDFVYFDPPYIITNAVYNEKNDLYLKKWDTNNENALYDLLNKLNEKGIKWGLSNTLEHKGKRNEILENFIKDYNVYEEKINRSSMGKGNSNTKEIFVCNY